MQYLLVDIPLSLAGFLLGFGCAFWYFRMRATLPPPQQPILPQEPSPPQVTAANGAANDIERVSMAAWELQDLAHKVSDEVGAHQNLVRSISEELDSNAEDAADPTAAVAGAVSKILVANDNLRGQLAEAEEKIRKQAEEIRTRQSEARTDPLTQLANRRALDNALAENHTRFAVNHQPFSLLFFDVDHFKQFNDTHGHLAGDEVLRQVANRLSKTVKTTDLLCRYGGEEFALLLTQTKIDAARIVAERVRQTIAGLSIEYEGKTLRLTASLGVAEVAPQDDSCTLIRRADECVYAAKAAGRNRSYWHDGENCHAIAGNIRPKQALTEDGRGSTNSASEESEQASGLEKLPDGAALRGELGRRIAESHRQGCSLSLIYLRVKDYNRLAQEYGNAVGWLLLDGVAQIIINTLRGTDLLAKLKDGNFVIMLPGSSEKNAAMVGRRIQKAITEYEIPLGKKDLPLKIEIGVTDIYPGDDADSMLARAHEVVGLSTLPVA